MDEDEGKHNMDLPLHSNIEDIRVSHYHLELTCDINNNVFSGCVILMLAHADVIDTENNASQFTEVDKIKEVERFKRNKAYIHKKNNQKIIRKEIEDINYGGDSSLITACEHEANVNVDRKETRDLTQNNTGSEITHNKCSEKGANQECFETLQNSLKSHRKGKLGVDQTDKESKVSGISSCHDLEQSNVKDLIQDDTIATTTSDIGLKSWDHSYTNTLQENQQIHNTFEEDNQIVDVTDPLTSEVHHINKDFVMVLDAWDLTVTSVQEVKVQSSHSDNECDIDKARLRDFVDSYDTNPLKFCSQKTCLKIWKPEIKSAKQFPRCIRITYQTQPAGPSLKWTKDQDGRMCVYTHGHWINNRSLFPSQDVPGALSTWRACIHVPEGMTVLMSGDQNPDIQPISPASNLTTYIYHTDLVVPSSTLALAVGFWEEIEIISQSCLGSLNSGGQLPCRLFTPRVHKDIACQLLKPYMPKCMEAAVSLLGTHPFKRLDILIVPASFASLGMASPSLMFLSQSVLSGDGHMLIRVAHELSHSWFGLAIGPLDWHEEWLSEGFCTYTESVIHGRVMKLTEEEFKEERNIYDNLKCRLLQAEVQSIGNELQTLRNADSDASGEKYVKNGMNPDKGFLQLHYLKGYFLLRHLEDTVGSTCFHGFLKDFVAKFHHKLIDSMDVLRLFFKLFPNKRSASLSEETICKDWLNSPGLPNISDFGCLKENKLADEVNNLKQKIHNFNITWKKLHWRKRRKLDLDSLLRISKLKQVQVLMLLDRLLDVNQLNHQILLHLNEKLGLSDSNADVRHKWCELVVKHKVTDRYKDVGHFLVHDQAMGVYLFGELIISQDKTQRQLAEEQFEAICSDMEEGVKQVVEAMIYGS